MSLVTEAERASIIREALRVDCGIARQNCLPWAGQFVFMGLGLVGMISAVLRSPSIAADITPLTLGLCNLLLAMCFRVEWKRRQALCVLKGVIAGDSDANVRPDTEQDGESVMETGNPYRSPET